MILNNFLFFTLSFFLAVNSIASTTKKNEVVRKTSPCKKIGPQILFNDINLSYQPYDNSMLEIIDLKCEKIIINQLTFYSIQLSSQSNYNGSATKLFFYEIVRFNEKSKKLTLFRSELIDSFRLQSDYALDGFSKNMEAFWGLDPKDGRVVVQIKMIDKLDPTASYSYLLKLNQQMDWFENVL